MMISPRFLVTPYFLDQFRPGLEAAAAIAPDTPLNEVPPDRGTDTVQKRVLPIYQAIKSFVHGSAQAGDVPVTLNGDCVMAIPVLAGLQAAGIDPLLLWFDAHGDFNTWDTTPSGFLGGMPLAMMMGLGEQTIMDGLATKRLEAANVVLTDGRDLDLGEVDLVAEAGITHLINIDDLKKADLQNKPLWIHFDCDVLHLDDLPAVSYPAAGGPTKAELAAVFDHLNQYGTIACISVSLPNPSLDANNRSLATTIELTKRLL